MGVANLVSRLNLNESQKWAGVINLFLHVGSNSCKVKGDWKFGVGMVQNRWVWRVWWLNSKIDHTCLKREQMEWTDFMHIDTDSQTLKTDQRFFLMDMVKNGCGQPGHRNLSLTVSQKWIDTNSG